jgi:hypothetical protein
MSDSYFLWNPTARTVLRPKLPSSLSPGMGNRRGSGVIGYCIAAPYWDLIAARTRASAVKVGDETTAMERGRSWKVAVHHCLVSLEGDGTSKP